MANPLKLNTVTQDTYRQICQESDLKVPYATWKEIVQTTNLAIGQAILEDPMGFQLPFELGILVVSKRKSRSSEFIDMVHLCKTGERKMQMNLATLGYYFTISWIRNPGARRFNSRFFLNEIYKFKAVRPLNRRLATFIKGGKDYFTTPSVRFKNTH